MREESHRTSWRALRQLRPVQLSILARRLRTYSLTAEVWALLKLYFPARFSKEHKTLTGPDWIDLLHYLFNLVEAADWFKIDRQDFTYAVDTYMEIDFPDEDDLVGWANFNAGREEDDYLTHFVKYVPVQLHGFTSSLIRLYPPMDLLRLLLSGSDEAAHGSEQLYLVLYQLDRWGPEDRQMAWDRLEAIEQDPARYPKLLRPLPRLAHWACGKSGNPILDLPPPGWGPDREQERRILQPHPFHFIWRRDTGQLRQFWQSAKPAIKALEQLMWWWTNQEEDCLIQLIKFLSEGLYDEFLQP